jgi:hypothetical protein
MRSLLMNFQIESFDFLGFFFEVFRRLSGRLEIDEMFWFIYEVSLREKV